MSRYPTEKVDVLNMELICLSTLCDDQVDSTDTLHKSYKIAKQLKAVASVKASYCISSRIAMA